MSGENFIRVKCGQCDTEFGMPEPLYIAAKNSEQIFWHCPYGHQRRFASGETKEDKLRRERDRLQQQLAQMDDMIKDAENRARAAKGQVTRLKNRAKAGVCPCCNRHFTNLERHMATKHGDMDPEEPLTAINGAA